MQVHRSTVGIVVQAPAKLNLFLEVLARCDDGYHEIETLMCPVSLYDTLYFKEEPSGQVELECERVLGADRTGSVRSGGTAPDNTEVPAPCAPGPAAEEFGADAR